ncbi:hypothetical protein QTV49_004881 [Vibrio vulnificus]|nr:hypothetical protein [Vibrio vulnificus]
MTEKRMKTQYNNILNTIHDADELLDGNHISMEGFKSYLTSSRVIAVMSRAGSGKSLFSRSLALEIGGNHSIFSSTELSPTQILRYLAPKVLGESLESVRKQNDETKLAYRALAAGINIMELGRPEDYSMDKLKTLIKERITASGKFDGVVLIDGFDFILDVIARYSKQSRAETHTSAFESLNAFAHEVGIKVIVTLFFPSSMGRFKSDRTLAEEFKENSSNLDIDTFITIDRDFSEEENPRNQLQVSVFQRPKNTLIGSLVIRDLSEDEELYCAEGCGECGKKTVEETTLTISTPCDNHILEREYQTREVSVCCGSGLAIVNTKTNKEEWPTEYEFVEAD